ILSAARETLAVGAGGDTAGFAPVLAAMGAEHSHQFARLPGKALAVRNAGSDEPVERRVPARVFAPQELEPGHNCQEQDSARRRDRPDRHCSPWRHDDPPRHGQRCLPKACYRGRGAKSIIGGSQRSTRGTWSDDSSHGIAPYNTGVPGERVRSRHSSQPPREEPMKPPAPPAAKPSSPAGPGSAAASPPRILIADDNPQGLELLEAYLAGCEYDIRTAADGEETLRQVA